MWSIVWITFGKLKAVTSVRARWIWNVLISQDVGKRDVFQWDGRKSIVGYCLDLSSALFDW